MLFWSVYAYMRYGETIAFLFSMIFFYGGWCGETCRFSFSNRGLVKLADFLLSIDVVAQAVCSSSDYLLK